MGVVRVRGLVFGEKDAREYTFPVEGRTNFMGLPPEEIEGLGLRKTMGQVRLMTADGVVESDTYFANAKLLAEGFGAILVPTAYPFIGYGLLENRRFRVNPVNQAVERVPDNELHPPFLLSPGLVTRWRTSASMTTGRPVRVRMARCLFEEPDPPSDPTEFDEWCESGNSGRPIQTHVGDEGSVLWVNPSGSICVQFDDGDERLLWPGEVDVVELKADGIS